MHTEQINFETPSSTESSEILVPETGSEEEVLLRALNATGHDELSVSRYDPAQHVVSPDKTAARDGVFVALFIPRANPKNFSGVGYAVAEAADGVRYRAFFPIKREGERVHLPIPLSGEPEKLLDEELAGLDDETA